MSNDYLTYYLTRAYNDCEFSTLQYEKSGNPGSFKREDTVNNRTAPAAVRTELAPTDFLSGRA